MSLFPTTPNTSPHFSCFLWPAGARRGVQALMNVGCLVLIIFAAVVSFREREKVQKLLLLHLILRPVLDILARFLLGSCLNMKFLKYHFLYFYFLSYFVLLCVVSKLFSINSLK